MKSLLGVYSINALGFATNLAAVFVFVALSGPGGYGVYGIYIVFLALFYLWDASLLKTALVLHQNEVDAGRDAAAAAASSIQFLRLSLLPFAAVCVSLFLVGDHIYPVDSVTAVGGSLVAIAIAVEHLLAYPANRLFLHLTIEKRFQTFYLVRLAGTLLRHLLAWSVLLITGSALWAIFAMVARGALFGAGCAIWTHRRYALQLFAPLFENVGRLAMLFSFVSAAVVVVAMQELPSVYIDRAYGRDAYGSYRMLYDLVGAVWFIATIYPTILFSSVLTERSQRGAAAAGARVALLGDRLALFHLAYFFAICALIAVDRQFFKGLTAEFAYAFGVVLGVALLGYSRFLVEVAQAQGARRHVVIATIATAGVVAATLFLAGAQAGTAEVGLAWISGQVFFFIALKAIIAATDDKAAKFYTRDIAILLAPLLVVPLVDRAWGNAATLMLSLVGLTIALATLGLLLLRSHRDGLLPHESRAN